MKNVLSTGPSWGFAVFLWLFLSPNPTQATTPAPAPSPVPPTFLLRGGTVWTATGKVLQKTDILVVGGRIAAIGRGLALPPGALLLDVRGKHLTPGLIDTHSHMGVYSTPSSFAHADGNEMVSPMTPHVWAAHATWPQDPNIPRAVEGGTTTAQILPGSANLIGGKAVTIKLAPRRSIQEMIFPKAPIGLKMACGENPKRVYRQRGLATRMGNVAAIRKFLLQARDYQDAWKKYHFTIETWKGKQAGRSGLKHHYGRKGPRTRMGTMAMLRQELQKGREAQRAVTSAKASPATPATSPTSQPEAHLTTSSPSLGSKGNEAAPTTKPAKPEAPEPKAPKMDFGMETMKELFEGKILAHIHCYRADDMRWMLEIADEFGFSIRSFHHATEAYKIRDILAKRGIAASVWSDWWGFKMEAYDAIEENAPLFASAGGRAIIHSDSSIGIQRLNHDAAKAFARGRALGLPLTEDEALRWVTANPAWALGIDKDTGTLEVGKMADITVWNGHPLSVYSLTRYVFIDGRIVYDRHKPRRPSDFEIGLIPPLQASPSAPPVNSTPSVPPAPHNPPAPPAHLTPTNAPLFLIRDAWVAPMTGQAAFRGDVLVKGSTILAVGSKLERPKEAALVDAGGRWLTPGLAIADTSLGTIEVDGEASTRNDSMQTLSAIRSAFRVSDAINPSTPTIPVARLAGVTTALIRPNGDLISGQSALIRLSRDPEQVLWLDSVAIHGQIHSNWRGSSGHAWLKLRQAFEDARFYKKNRVAFASGRSRFLSASRIHLEALLPVIEGRLPFVLSVNRASDIRIALRFAREQGIRLVLNGALEGWQVAHAIAKAKIPVILGPTRNTPQSFDALTSRNDNAAILAKAGVTLAFGAGGSAHFVRNLPHEVAVAVSYGLPHDTALRALTQGLFSCLGLEASSGSIAPQKQADLVLWSGDPLELSSRPVALWIQGQSQPLVSRQTLLRDRYLHLPLPLDLP